MGCWPKYIVSFGNWLEAWFFTKPKLISSSSMTYTWLNFCISWSRASWVPIDAWEKLTWRVDCYSKVQEQECGCVCVGGNDHHYYMATWSTLISNRVIAWGVGLSTLWALLHPCQGPWHDTMWLPSASWGPHWVDSLIFCSLLKRKSPSVAHHVWF